MDAAAKRRDEKISALRGAHALNGRPQAVSDPAFSSGNPFFDRADLVQVKYEMVRRVAAESAAVTQTAAAFGFSRPSFYAIQAVFERGGLPALLPQRPGPRHAHKLGEEVVDLLERERAADPSANAAGLAAILRERLGFSVHPRSIERALERRRKKPLQGSAPR